MSKENQGEFAELLKALSETENEADALVKAIPADGDDQTINAAAENSEDDEAKAKAKAEGGAATDPLAKSMTVTGTDGVEIEAIDATEIIKSLQDRVGQHDEVLTKAMTGMVSTLKAQGALIKSLQENMAKLAGQGAGRKTMVMAIEKPALGAADQLAKSQSGEMSVGDLMAKAEVAYSAGKITGNEYRLADACVRHGQPIDPAVVRKIALS